DLAGAFELTLVQVEGVEETVAAAGPPDAVFPRGHGEAEPTLPGAFGHQYFSGNEIDERHFMAVESVGGDECVLVVLERVNVERQVGDLDVFAGGRKVPAVGQEEAGLGRSGDRDLIVGERVSSDEGGEYGSSEMLHEALRVAALILYAFACKGQY